MRPRLGLTLAAVLLAPGLATAGPWAKGKGHFYAKLSYQRLRSDELAQPNGKVLPIPDFSRDEAWFYGELGLSDSVNLVVDAPLLRSSNLEDDPDELPRETGVGDLRAGLQWQLARRGNWVFAVRGMFQAPTGDETRGDGLLPTGSGVWEGDGSFGAGLSFAGGRGWTFLEAGYGYRSRLRDGVVYSSQVGWRVGNRLLLAANLHGVEPFSKTAPATAIGSPVGVGDRVTYTSVGPTAILKLGERVSLQLDWETPFNARNLAKGPVFRFGVAFQQ